MKNLPHLSPSGKRPVEVLVVGNTHTTLTAFSPNPTLAKAVRTDELAACAEDLLRARPDPSADLVVVSVVPPIEPTIASIFPGATFLAAEAAPIDIAYLDPSTLGPDRIANALAARALFGAPVLTVDCGTATTFTAVDSDGRLAGGAIAVGLGTARDALAARGARLPTVDLAVLPPGPATDTRSALQIGLVHGHAGLIQHLCKLLAPATPILLTGGWSALLAPLIPRSRRVEHLTALGGKVYHDAR